MKQSKIIIFFFGIMGSSFLFFGLTFFYLRHLDPSDPEIQSSLPQYPWFPDFIIAAFILVGIGFIIAMIINYLRYKSSGKIKIQLDKGQYNPGDKIEGIVKLNLKKLKSAKSFKIKFIGERVIQQRDRNGYRERSVTFYEDEVTLDTEKEYLDEAYPFRIFIPEDLMEKVKNFDESEYGYIGNKQIKLGKTMSALSKKAENFAKSQGFVNINKYDRCYLLATLEITNGLDIRTGKDIVINVAN